MIRTKEELKEEFSQHMLQNPLVRLGGQTMIDMSFELMWRGYARGVIHGLETSRDATDAILTKFKMLEDETIKQIARDPLSAYKKKKPVKLHKCACGHFEDKYFNSCPRCGEPQE